MAPTRMLKGRASTASENSVAVNSFPEPPSGITKVRSPARTPTGRSPIKKAPMRITVNQKQALIDNLQLEITERARKLRAQYAMQAQGLRTRVELRVNRIPTALRKLTMGELLLKYSESIKPQLQSAAMPSQSTRPAPNATPRRNALQQTQSHTRQSPSPMRPVKRLSNEIMDKENDDLENPKKRLKAPVVPERAASRKMADSQVLSPRSANSRTIPRSPIRPLSPQKSFLARPIGSPLKPSAPGLTGGASSMLHHMVEKAKNTRVNTTRKVTTSSTGSSNAGAGRGKRQPAAAPPPKVGKGRASASSQSSDASSGTVVQKKGAPVKRTVMGTIKGAVQKKTVAAKVAAPAATGRVLRKRT